MEKMIERITFYREKNDKQRNPKNSNAAISD